MTEGIRPSAKGDRTVYLSVGAWYDAETGHIHLTVPSSGWFHSTVNNNPESVRGHPNLYRKLARVLKEAGKPYPQVLGDA